MRPVVLSSDDISRAIRRISHEILEKNKGCSQFVLVGIRTRGEYLAKRLQAEILDIDGETVNLGVLDITLYRDDIGSGKQIQEIKKTEIPFPIDGKIIILCDDVLFTGRTIRAAIDALMDFGRPAGVQLAVLIDRGHRELPIRPDYVGKNIPTSKTMKVKVQMKEEDDQDQVILIEVQE